MLGSHIIRVITVLCMNPLHCRLDRNRCLSSLDLRVASSVHIVVDLLKEERLVTLQVKLNFESC